MLDIADEIWYCAGHLVSQDLQHQGPLVIETCDQMACPKLSSIDQAHMCETWFELCAIAVGYHSQHLLMQCDHSMLLTGRHWHRPRCTTF